MKRCDKLAKTVQRRVYDFLLTRYGVSLLCFSMLIVIVCLIQLSDTILEYRINEFKQFANIVNLKRTTSVRSSTQAEHVNNYEDFGQLDASLKTNIDVVYTWVNGSDPAHLAMIKKYKLNESHQDESHNSSSRTQRKFLSVEFTQFYEKVMQISPGTDDTITSTTTSTTTTTTTTGHFPEFNSENDDDQQLTQWPCFHKLCMQTNNLIVILPQLKPMNKQSFLYNAKVIFKPDLFSNISIDNIEKFYHENDHFPHNDDDDNNDMPAFKPSLADESSLSILYINNFDFKANRTILRQMNGLFKRELLTKGYKLFMGYYTIDCGMTLNCVKELNRTFIVKKLKSTLNNENLTVDSYLENIGNIHMLVLF
jgi:hypothetical protein